ncbi:exodeoxyribonuclease III [soil metagenome]
MAKAKKTTCIYSWNVNGIRAVQNKGFMDWFSKVNCDVLCLQETKAQPDQIPDYLRNHSEYDSHWFSALKKGYSSVGVMSKIKPVHVKLGFDDPFFDTEGRVIICEYEKFALANVYFPNGGRGPERVKYKLDFYNELFFYLNKNYKERKGVIVTGDFNTAHKPIDLARPDANRNNSGFLDIEREWIDKIINLGYVDVYRKFHAEPEKYTFWDNFTKARERNAGWRIDYFMVSENLVKNVVAAEIHSDILGSDHCPISITLQF